MLNNTRMGMGGSIIVAVAAAIALIGWELPLLWRIITVALLIISISSIVIVFDQKRMRQQERLIQAANQQAVELMNHKRHDWMNDLQLLYGYVRMNKLEKLPPYVERLKHEAMEESRVAKLGYPELVLYLMQQRLTGGMMPVEVHVQDMIDITKLEMSLSPEQVTDLIIKGIQAFRTAPKQQDGYEANEPLKLSIEQQDGQLLIRYEYEGKLLLPDDVKKRLEEAATERGVRLEQLLNTEQSAGNNVFTLEWRLALQV